MLKLIILVLIIYFGGKLIKDLLFPTVKQDEVKGRPKKKPIDLRGKDVEDADFEEIDE